MQDTHERQFREAALIRMAVAATTSGSASRNAAGDSVGSRPDFDASGIMDEEDRPCRTPANWMRQGRRPCAGTAMLLNVETIPGHAGMMEPAAFWLGSDRLAVLEIVDRWPAVDYTYFKITASDQASYILRHDTHVDAWELTLYKSPGSQP
jgi:hypothetical protein